MRDKKCNRSSGIGGQAVLEGVMMKNKDDYAVAIRKPDGEIEVEVDVYRGVLRGSRLKQIPFIRGIFNFLDSLILGMKTLNYSASFYEDGEAEETKLDKALNKISGGKAETILMGFTTAFSIVLAIAVFIMLPYFLSSSVPDRCWSHVLPTGPAVPDQTCSKTCDTVRSLSEWNLSLRECWWAFL